MTQHTIDSRPLDIDCVKGIILSGAKLTLSKDSIDRIVRCREYLDSKMKDSGHPVYGVTTGFGSLCDITIPEEDLSQLQHNLVMSHACGTGPKVRKEIVKLMLFLKVQSLSYGYSGVQLATVQRLIDMYNNDICPVVYEQGSLGASGDLAPLAHLSLPLIGMGEVEYKGQIRQASELWEELGWKPIRLQSKEGLALLNGTQFMSAIAVWSLIRCKELSAWADRIGAISLEAYDGRIEPFLPQVHAIRAHKGQAETAAAFRKMLEGSSLVSREKVHVQDPYSFRCIPQVHGAVKDTIRYVESVIDTEINSATDIAMSELANISERRIYRLISGQRGLPKFLVAKPGLNSGFMIPQYTAASIVSQNKMLCHPASADSIPSSQGQEDHVSMGANAATKLIRVVENTERVLAIELFNAAQALEFRRPARSSWCIEKIVAAYRKKVLFIEDDTYMHPYIDASIDFIRQEWKDNQSA